MTENILEKLKSIPEFISIPQDQLQWLVDNSALKYYSDGEKAFNPGDPIEHLTILLKGKIRMYTAQAGNLVYFDTIEENEITGRLPYSRMKGSTSTGIVQGETISLRLHKDLFPEMIRNHYELTQTFVHCMTDRVRYTMKQQQVNDKMISLGKLSAGLAHELNNPSAAVIRSANALKKHLANLPEKFKSVIKIRTDEAVVDAVNKLVFEKIEWANKLKLSLMEKTSREDELLEWMERNEIAEPETMLDTFVDYGFRTEDFDHLKALLRKEDRNAVIQWLSQVLLTERLVDEIEDASVRINKIVSSVKSYTHMDHAPVKERVDIHQGLRNTLTMLSHKIRKNNVKVVEDFQGDLPMPLVYVGPINQVWTNIIDNALDAMEGRTDNVLSVKTEKDREFIMVHIGDNGPGIPPEIQDKIFDSFFTTKPIGKGTGLGLEIVRQIMMQHNGKVDVKSKPGDTQFRVCFPIQ